MELHPKPQIPAARMNVQKLDKRNALARKARLPAKWQNLGEFVPPCLKLLSPHQLQAQTRQWEERENGGEPLGSRFPARSLETRVELSVGRGQ